MAFFGLLGRKNQREEEEQIDREYRRALQEHDALWDKKLRQRHPDDEELNPKPKVNVGSFGYGFSAYGGTGAPMLAMSTATPSIEWILALHGGSVGYAEDISAHRSTGSGDAFTPWEGE